MLSWVVSLFNLTLSIFVLIVNCCWTLGKIKLINNVNKKNKIINVHVYCVKKVTMSNCGI